MSWDLLFNKKKDWVTKYTPTAIRRKRRVRIAQYAVLCGFTLLGLLALWRGFASQANDLQQPGDYFHRVMSPKLFNKGQIFIN